MKRQENFHPYGDSLHGVDRKHMHELFLIIHHPLYSTFLLHKNSRCGQLPRLIEVEDHGEFSFQKTSEWIPELKETFSIEFDLTLLRCLWYKNYGEVIGTIATYGTVQAVIVLEAHGDTSALPSEMQWMDVSSILFPKVVLDEGSAIVAEFFEECATGIQPSRRPLFARPGWYCSAVEWVGRELARNGFGEVQKVEQVRCTWRGCVLKCFLGDGSDVYLKCSPFFSNEAPIYEALLKLIPKYIPRPLSIHSSQCLVLLEDVGPIFYPGQFSDEEAGEWVKELSDIHQSTICATGLLEKAGLRWVTTQVMCAQLEKILQYVGRTKLVSQDFIDRFRSVCDDIHQECEKVEELGLPNTFSHCDLHSSNIFRHENGVNKFGILDFGDSSISNPLMDTVMCRSFKGYVKCWARYFEATENGRAVLEETGSYIISGQLQMICSRLSILRDLVLNFLAMDEMESGELPQLRSFMVDSIHCIVRDYERGRSRKKGLTMETKL